MEETRRDIIEVLRESSKELQKLLEGLSREDFSEVFLFFDYDAHQTNLGNADGQDALKQMLESFDNETENGKLYVSYPMVEALRDYEPNVCGNKESCFVYMNEIVNYKTDSAARSHNPHVRDYSVDTWKEIIDIENATMNANEVSKAGFVAVGTGALVGVAAYGGAKLSGL